MRSKTEPPTTSCWQAAWAGRHPVMLHPAQHPALSALELSLLTISRDKYTQAINVCTHAPQAHKHAHTQTQTHAHIQWHQLGKCFLAESSQNPEERARSCLCCREAAYLRCDLHTHERVSDSSRCTEAGSHCRCRVMFSGRQIKTEAQECADSAVAMADSQQLAKSPLLQYKVTTLVSFLHEAMWLASPTGMRTQ